VTEPPWRFLYFDIERNRWITNFSPSFDEAARLRLWRATIETAGFPPGTVFWEDENFVARVPNSRVVVAGIAVTYEHLLIVQTIISLGAVP